MMKTSNILVIVQCSFLLPFFYFKKRSTSNTAFGNVLLWLLLAALFLEIILLSLNRIEGVFHVS